MPSRAAAKTKGQRNLSKGDITRLLSISSVMSCHGRHIGFDRTGNSAFRSADSENPTLKRNMKWIGWHALPIYGLRKSTYHEGCISDPHLGREGRLGSRRSYHSKERYWFPMAAQCLQILTKVVNSHVRCTNFECRSHQATRPTPLRPKVNDDQLVTGRFQQRGKIFL